MASEALAEAGGFQINQRWRTPALSQEGAWGWGGTLAEDWAWVVEVLADRSPLFRRGCVHDPKEKKKRHHRRGEVGEGHLPRTAMVTVALLDHPLDDNGRRLAHASPRRNSSSSEKEGRSSLAMILRPNSTAICGL